MHWSQTESSKWSLDCLSRRLGQPFMVLWSREEAPFMIGGAGSQYRMCRNIMRYKGLREDRGHGRGVGAPQTIEDAHVSRTRIVLTRPERDIDVKAPVQRGSGIQSLRACALPYALCRQLGVDTKIIWHFFTCELLGAQWPRRHRPRLK